MLQMVIYISLCSHFNHTGTPQVQVFIPLVQFTVFLPQSFTSVPTMNPHLTWTTRPSIPEPSYAHEQSCQSHHCLQTSSRYCGFGHLNPEYVSFLASYYFLKQFFFQLFFKHSLVRHLSERKENKLGRIAY